MNRMLPCPSCRRHVNVSESACPFCECELDFDAGALRPLPSARLGRAATFTFGASLVGLLSGACGGNADQTGPDVKLSGGTTGSGGTTSGGETANPDGGYPVFPGGGIGVIYGAPVSGGTSAGGHTQGSVGGSYGTPPISGGFPGSGGIGVIYGAPITGGTYNEAGGDGSFAGIYGAPIAGAGGEPNGGSGGVVDNFAGAPDDETNGGAAGSR